MHDQAQNLRDRLESIKNSQTKLGSTRILTVTSGKGGVGKSNFTLNFALALQSEGYKVLVFDADIGLANLDLLMGVRPTHHLVHLLTREKQAEEIICTGPNGLKFIAGGTGFQELFRLSEGDLDYFSEEVNRLTGQYDFVIFDTGAGLAKETMKFIMAAEETILVTTPEPPAITDAYAVMKMVHQKNAAVQFRLVVNRVSNRREGIETSEKLCLTAQRFLQLNMETLGFIADDPAVSQAVKHQVPFTIRAPHCAASKGIREISKQYLQRHHLDMRPQSGMKGFVARMIQLLK